MRAVVPSSGALMICTPYASPKYSLIRSLTFFTPIPEPRLLDTTSPCIIFCNVVAENTGYEMHKTGQQKQPEAEDSLSDVNIL